jgi:hypothetical protein
MGANVARATDVELAIPFSINLRGPKPAASTFLDLFPKALLN